MKGALTCVCGAATFSASNTECKVAICHVEKFVSQANP